MEINTDRELSGSAAENLRGRADLLNFLEDCLKSAAGQGDQVELVLGVERVAVTRFAHNRIHQNIASRDERLWVRVLANGALASLASNSLDPADIKNTISQAARIARRLPDFGNKGFAASSNESGPNLEPGAEGLELTQTAASASAPSLFETTASQTPAQRAGEVGRLVEKVKEAGLESYGTYKTVISELAVANNVGLRSYASSTSGYLKALVENNQGTTAGFADGLSRDVSALDPEGIAAAAIRKCLLNHDQIALEPGDYEAVLEPNTVADLVRFMVIHGCGAQQLQDGRSFMTGRFGEKVTGSNITIREDPNDPRAMPFSLDYEGLQKRAVPLVVEGKPAGVVYDRQTAARIEGRRSTGHAAYPWSATGDSNPLPTHIIMEGGTGRTVDQLVKGMKRGVLITRLHYTHCPDPRRVVATGTTRDGTFLVENGEIVAAVKNLRLTQSVLELLAGVEEFGQAKTCQDWWAANGMGFTNYSLPALRVSRCTFTGATTF